MASVWPAQAQIAHMCAGAENCINSDGILELDTLPKRLAIIGAGYIGVEFGGMFNNLGASGINSVLVVA